MKIAFLTLGPEIIPSSRTRVYQYLPHLQRAGWEGRVLPHSANLPALVYLPAYPALARLMRSLLWHLDVVYQTRQLRRFEQLAETWADVIFIQKVLLPFEAQVRLHRLGKPVVFDFDDALFADRQHYDVARFDHQLEHCDLVVLENEHTQQYAESRGCCTLRITGPIDTDRYTPASRPPSPGDPVILGWIGSASTLPHLETIAGALAQVAAQCPSVAPAH